MKTHKGGSIIKNSRDLDVRNLDALPRGTGCRYLVCLLSPDDTALIASRWARKEPKTVGRIEVVIDLK